MRYSRLILAVLAASAMLNAHDVYAQAPDSLSHQGLLTDAAGVPVADGNYDILFSLYDTLSGGVPLWLEAHHGPNAEPVKNGIFNAVLGRFTSLSSLVFNKPMYLAVRVNGDPDIVPRTSLTAVPYARALPGMYTFYRDDISWQAYNVVGGGPGNVVGPGVVGATIGGGGGWILASAMIPNSVLEDYGTVSGGWGNTAGNFGATVGGGEKNTASGAYTTVSGGGSSMASGSHATVGGGWSNTASGPRATVPGGEKNAARGDGSFAAGYKARAIHDGTFVWNDRSMLGGNDSLLSTNTNQFIIRAVNGVGINRAPANYGIHLKQQGISNNYGIRTEFSADTDYWDTHIDFDNDYNFSFTGTLRAWIFDTDGTYHSFSDARLKEDVQPYGDVLESITKLHPSTYRFKQATPSSARSLGIMAQEIEPLFPELVSEKDGMKGMNYAGLSVVAIKAIQELYALVQAQQQEMDRMRAAMGRAGIQ